VEFKIETVAPQIPGKLTIVVEDNGMDSGSIHSILEACHQQGKVLEAYVEWPNGGVLDQMHAMEFIE
jgi:hypothetical protein